MHAKEEKSKHKIQVYKLIVFVRYILVVEEKMVGPIRPQIVLFGSSIVQLSYSDEGWGSILTNLYSRKVLSYIYYFMLFLFILLYYSY